MFVIELKILIFEKYKLTLYIMTFIKKTRKTILIKSILILLDFLKDSIERTNKENDITIINEIINSSNILI